MDKKICSICEESISGNEYEELDSGDIVCKSCAEKCCGKCVNCEGLFPKEELTEEDGEYYCEYCHGELFDECYMCGKIFPAEDMQYWGDVLICPECMEEQCPSFDEEENEKETTEAYEAMLKKYVGRKSTAYKGKEVDLSTGTSDSNTDYSITVTLDDDGIITDVSRLSAEMLLSESERSSEWRPLAIKPDDYEWMVDDLMEELELEETAEDEEEEDEE